MPLTPDSNTNLLSEQVEKNIRIEIFKCLYILFVLSIFVQKNPVQSRAIIHFRVSQQPSSTVKLVKYGHEYESSVCAS
jgi:hypothetical protein